MRFFFEAKLPYRFFFFLLFALFSFSAPLFAQKNNAAMNEVAHLLENDGFLRRGVFRNADKITEIAKDLPFENRQLLYNRYAEETSAPFWMNAVVGFGLGSFMQKNYIHASVQATGDTIFTYLLLSSLSGVFRSKSRLEGARQEYYNYTSSPYTSRNEELAKLSLKESEDEYKDALGTLAIVTMFWTFFRIYECVTPILFTRSYNKKLAKSLGIYDFSANITPSISMDGSLNMNFSVALKL